MIRAAALSDAPALAALHKAGFDRPWPVTDFVDHLNAPADHILIGGGGFILLRCAADQAEILTITVHPDRRGQGIGAKLLAAGEAHVSALGAQVLFLDVAEDNAPALALYRRAGFTQIGSRPGYYRRAKGRVGARIFQKRLVAGAAPV